MSGGPVVSDVQGDVASTVGVITAVLHGRGVTLFATIDHAAGARGAGLELADEVVLVFGNPAAGTPLMQADPRVGIDLPLRILVRSDSGTTRLAFEDPARLAETYALDGQQATLARLRGPLDQLVTEAGRHAR